jgi:predicted metal-dependent phosphoesterase TrpH
VAGADLHIHTTASDGMLSPPEVVRRADALNLSTIAITDHDTVGGMPAALKEASNSFVRILTGAEITSSFKNRNCHLLAYHFDLLNKGLKSLLHHHQKERCRRACRIIHALREKGLKIDIDETMAEANGSPVGRPHIAAILQKKGYAASSREVFARYLNDEALGDAINVNYSTCEEVIQVVHEAGGAVVLAHPGILYTSGEIEELIQQDIDGIEAVHPSHDTKTEAKMKELAASHHLIITGGSDFHGKAQTSRQQLGGVTIDQEKVKKLIDIARRRQKIMA